MTETTPIAAGFNNLGISSRLLQAIANQKFTSPTPIQSRVLPLAIEGKDVVGIAQTGTGKTLAFGIPTMQKLLEAGRGQALILCPTRELAMQVDEMITRVGRPLGLKTAVVIGGVSANTQISALRRNPHIIIATPGRLNDLLKQRQLNLNEIKVIILDEADRMLDIGFMPQIKTIMSQAPKERQTLLFSATMPAEIAEIARNFMKTPVRIEVAPQGTTAENVEQEMFIVTKDQKNQLLDKILGETTGSVLVFSRTKHGAKKITRSIAHFGHTAVEIHSNRSFAQRKAALEGFKSRRFRVLVATDIAARGIDVKDISLVINYDMPDDLDDYVHRIGRTGRAGSSGKAITFVCPEQRYDIRTLERIIRKPIKVSSLPVLPPRREAPQAERPMREFRNDRPSFRGQSSERRPMSGRQPAYGRRPSYERAAPISDRRPAYGRKPAVDRYSEEEDGPSRPGYDSGAFDWFKPVAKPASSRTPAKKSNRFQRRGRKDNVPSAFKRQRSFI